MNTMTTTVAGMEVSLLDMFMSILFTCVVLKVVHEQYQAYVERSSDELQVEITAASFDTIRQPMSKSAKVNDLEVLIMKRHADVLRVERMACFKNEKEETVMKKDHTLDEYASDMRLVVHANVAKVAVLIVYFTAVNHNQNDPNMQIPTLTIRPNRDDTVDGIYDQVDVHMQQHGVNDAVNLEVDSQALPRGQLLVDACDMSNTIVFVYVMPQKTPAVIKSDTRSQPNGDCHTRSLASALQRVVPPGVEIPFRYYTDDFCTKDANKVQFNMNPSNIEEYTTGTNMMRSGTLNSIAQAGDKTVPSLPSLEIVDKFNIAFYMDPYTFISQVRPIWNTLLNISKADMEKNKYLKHMRDLFSATAKKLAPLSFDDIRLISWDELLTNANTTTVEDKKKYVYRQIQFVKSHHESDRIYKFETHAGQKVTIDFNQPVQLLGQAPFVSFSMSPEYIQKHANDSVTEKVLIVYRLYRDPSVNGENSCIKNVPRLMGNLTEDAEKEVWCVQPTTTELVCVDVETRGRPREGITLGVTIEERNKSA